MHPDACTSSIFPSERMHDYHDCLSSQPYPSKPRPQSMAEFDTEFIYKPHHPEIKYKFFFISASIIFIFLISQHYFLLFPSKTQVVRRHTRRQTPMTIYLPSPHNETSFAVFFPILNNIGSP